jgi:hypothetical protein
MADGFDIHLDPERAAKLKAMADLLDMTPEAYAALLIDRGLGEVEIGRIDPDPAIDRAIVDHARRTDQAKPWSEVRDRLLARHGR